MKKLSLPVQIFISLLLGIVVGLICYFAGLGDFTANYLKPFGDIFVNPAEVHRSSRGAVLHDRRHYFHG